MCTAVIKVAAKLFNMPYEQVHMYIYIYIYAFTICTYTTIYFLDIYTICPHTHTHTYRCHPSVWTNTIHTLETIDATLTPFASQITTIIGRTLSISCFSWCSLFTISILSLFVSILYCSLHFVADNRRQ